MRSYPCSNLKFFIGTLSILSIALLTSFALSYRASSRNVTRLGKLPGVIFWAWERPESLAHLESSRATTAFLSQTIYLRDDDAVVRPRLQPLRVAPGAPLIAVTRIESEDPLLSANQQSETVSAIIKSARLPDVIAVQIDFDATVSERSFYRDLLFALRKQLPESTALSITALASWCKGDNWLDDLPIDEAVPMLFRMGQERNQFLAALASGESFQSRKCRGSVGISTDEPVTDLKFPERVYVFNSQSWSPESTDELLRKIENEKAP
ncbi:MAG TPA: DUF3142 domain-containing protein [Pyrinomonadaceae bacterium]|jgi:hypothetical protein